MKKILRSALLLSLLSVLLLVGCAGEPESAPTPEPTPEVVQTPAPEMEPESTPEPDPEPETAPEPATASGEIVTELTDRANYWIEFEGLRLAVGDAFTVLEEQFKIGPLSEGILDETLAPNTRVSIYFHPWADEQRIGENASVSLANLTDEEILVRDGEIFSFHISGRFVEGSLAEGFFRNESAGFSFINGIEIGVTTSQEILDMFGEPTQTTETNMSLSHVFNPIPLDVQSGYTFIFDQQTDLLLRVQMAFLD